MECRRVLYRSISSIDDLQPNGTYLLRVSPSLRIVPITEHISIAEVPGTVSAAAVSSLIGLVDETFRRWGVNAPRIGVAGLNPHAMGTEEVREKIGRASCRERVCQYV